MKKYLSTVLTALMLTVVSVHATDKGSLSQYNPFEEIQKMQQEMDAIFERFHKKMVGEEFFSKFDSSFPARPAVDLKDVGDAYQLKADIPGSDENEIKITTENGLLKIEAKSAKVKEEKKKDFLKQERFVGSYMRAVSLPKDADTEKLKSDYKDGVLTITIPKKK